MNFTKSYIDSLVSALCIIIMGVITFKTLYSGEMDNVVEKFVWTWLIIISTGIVGGIVLHFVAVLKNRKLKYSFAYNFLGTLNIMVGGLFMFFPIGPGPMAASSLIVGIIIYKNIYA